VTGSEWYGEPHTLIVRSVTPPEGQFDDGELDYDIEHPASCKQELCGEGDHAYMIWTCDLAQNEAESGLPFCLRYSGTPVTEPGTYRIQAWGRKDYFWESGWEYDGGIGVMADERAEATP
jgi:hypothetical protein